MGKSIFSRINVKISSKAKKTFVFIVMLFLFSGVLTSSTYSYHILRAKIGLKYALGFTSCYSYGDFREYTFTDLNLDRFQSQIAFFTQPAWGNTGGIYLYVTHLPEEREQSWDMFSVGMQIEVMLTQRNFIKEYRGMLVKNIESTDGNILVRQDYTAYNDVDVVFFGIPVLLRIKIPYNIIANIGLGFQILAFGTIKGHTLELSPEDYWLKEVLITSEDSPSEYMDWLQMDIYLGLGYLLDFGIFTDILEDFRIVPEVRFFINASSHGTFYFGNTRNWGFQFHVNIEYFDIDI